MKTTKKQYALHYYDNGLIPIPLCWPIDNMCGCFHQHQDEKQIGKAPLVSYTKNSITREKVSEWFSRSPNANIGIVLHESNLVVVDADSKEAVQEVQNIFKGYMVPTVETSRGKHFYFRTSKNTPIYRATGKGKSGKIDILSNGCIAAPPSVHLNGHQYHWSHPPKEVGHIPTIPNFLEQFLIQEKTKHASIPFQAHTSPLKLPNVVLDTLPLNDFIKDLIKRGEGSPYYQERGYQSRSEAIFGIIISCVKSGLSDEQIYSILLNPKHAISHKILAQKKGVSWLTPQLIKARKKVVPQRPHKLNPERN